MHTEMTDSEIQIEIQFDSFNVTNLMFNPMVINEAAEEGVVNFEPMIETSLGVPQTEETQNFLIDFRVQLLIESNKAVALDQSAIGIFKTGKALLDPKEHEIVAENGPNIVFPFVRSYISTLFTLSGYAPYYLPILNFARPVDGTPLLQAQAPLPSKT